MINVCITLLSSVDNYLPDGLWEFFELGLIFLCLYGLIFALLLTSKENNYFQKQR